MSRTLLSVVIVALMLGAGAGFGAGWSRAPRLVAPAAALEPTGGSLTAEQRSAREALDGWIGESARENYHRVSTVELRAGTREDNPEGGPYFLLDVRDRVDWLSRHIQGSVNVPLTSLTALQRDLPADRDTRIVTICADGHRGALAVAVLRTLGYTNVRTLTGGINAWVNDGYPIVTYAY